MFSAALIVLREVLEAALIIGIVAAATRDVSGRNRWLVGGLAAGLAGSALIALFTEAIGAMASGVGQELFNATILCVAVLMLAWHCIWMASHGRELAAQAKSVGRSISDGSRECSVLFAIIAIAVLREGAEVALFLYGITLAPGSNTASTFGGALIGLAAGVAIGWGLYAGLLRVPMRLFFSLTNALVLMLAAGLAAQAVGFLVQADIVPALGSPIWDTAGFVPPGSVAGVVLHALAGYEARPSGIQALAYLLTLISIGAGMRFTRAPAPSPVQTQGAVS